MYVLLTQRKLKPGSYDAWRKAWWPEDLPEDAGPPGKAYIIRNVEDENDIIAFGMFESDPREVFSDPKLQEIQANRVMDALREHRVIFRGKTVIPIRFHIIHVGAQGYLPHRRLKAQVALLNCIFAPAQIAFSIAEATVSHPNRYRPPRSDTATPSDP